MYKKIQIRGSESTRCVWANEYSINWGKGGKITKQMGRKLGLEGRIVRDCERGKKNQGTFRQWIYRVKELG